MNESKSGLKEKKSFLPQNKPLRIVVQLIIVAIGLYAIYSGVSQMGRGVSELADTGKIQIQGCRGISAQTVKCDYVNVGQVKARACMDLVMVCADGRHVAPACSEPIAPGDSSTKLIDNFNPAIEPTVACTSMAYEKTRTET